MELIHTNLSSTTSLVMFVLILSSAIANLFDVDMFFIFTTMHRQVVLRLTYIIFIICGVVIVANQYA
jgi:hypothetical protein